MRIAETRLPRVLLALSFLGSASWAQAPAKAPLRAPSFKGPLRAPAAYPRRIPSFLKQGKLFGKPISGKLKLTRHPLIVPIPKETLEYKRAFRILMAHPETTDRYDELILRHARRYGLDPRLLKAIISAESEFNPTVRSPSGALGLMQLMPKTAREMGYDPRRLREPDHNIAAGAAYMNRLYQSAWVKYKLKGVEFQDAPLWLVQRVIGAYHAGPTALGKHQWSYQTVHYVRKVQLFYRSEVTDIRRIPSDPRWPGFQTASLLQ